MKVERITIEDVRLDHSLRVLGLPGTVYKNAVVLHLENGEKRLLTDRTEIFTVPAVISDPDVKFEIEEH